MRPCPQAMLIGEYTHSIDDKNRISLPARFRQRMGRKVVITPGLDHCLFVFMPKEWGKISAKLSEASIGQSDSRSFSRFMFGGAVEADVDSIGRILVPDFLQSWANLKGRVSVVGVESRVEIWNEKAWNAYKKGVEGKAGALAEKLGQIGVI